MGMDRNEKIDKLLVQRQKNFSSDTRSKYYLVVIIILLPNITMGGGLSYGRLHRTDTLYNQVCPNLWSYKISPYHIHEVGY